MTYNKSSNMTLNAFEKVHLNNNSSNTMSFSGTLNKTLILLTLVILGAFVGWTKVDSTFILPIFFISLITGFIIALVLAFKPMLAKYLAPVYALLEGVFLGVISLFFEVIYPGIVIQAALLTLSVALLMNFLYRNKIIVVTEKFRSVLIMATFSIFFVYLISIILSFFSINIPYIHGSGPFGILFSLVVVTIASLNLLLDFDFIDKASDKKLPVDMEWYGAFALTVTLVWIYIEILKLLAKLRSRD